MRMHIRQKTQQKQRKNARAQSARHSLGRSFVLLLPGPAPRVLSRRHPSFGFDVSATARHAACGKHARNPCAHACESGYLSLIIDLSQTPRARVPFTPHATGTRTLERTGLFAFGDFVPPPQFMAASHASFSWPGRSPGPAPSN